jgi:SnoaL-like domain
MHDDVESIRRLKYAYFRLLDTKQFRDLGKLFVTEGTTAYEAGTLRQTGRDAIVEFLVSSLGDPGIVTFHTGHHPEIDVGSDGTAKGIWYLEDRVIVPAFDLVLGGTALYEDEYVIDDGAWRIRHTGYQRIYEERRRMKTGELISFSSRFDPAQVSQPLPF